MAHLELCFRLCELPSPQHRAGLGGLLHLLRHTAIAHHRDSDSLSLSLSQAALESLLATLYQGTDATRLRKTKPSGEFTEVEVVGEDGEAVTRYQQVVRRPAGSWFSGLSQARLGLWQDQIWFVLRPIAASRRIYDQPVSELAGNLWAALRQQAKGRDVALPLSSALYAGARVHNAEGADFRGRPDQVLLLHFAHALVQPFAIVSEDKRGQAETMGSALVFLDPEDLLGFPTVVNTLLEHLDGSRASCSEEAALIVLAACPGLGGVLSVGFVEHGHTVNLASMVRVSGDVVALAGKVNELKLYDWRRLASRNVVAGRSVHHGAATLLSRLAASRAAIPAEETPDYLHDARCLLPPGDISLQIRRWLGDHTSQHDSWAEWTRTAAGLWRRLRGARTKTALGHLLAELGLVGVHARLESDWRELSDLLFLAVAAHARPGHFPVPDEGGEL